jgi:hypothetical protein
MRTSHWAVLVGLCLAAELSGTTSVQAQSMLFPVGQPYTFAGGFSGPTVNAPTNIASSNNVSDSVLKVIPQQSTGMMMPSFRNLMLFPNRNTVNGVSALPAPSAFPGASFFNNLNPFAKVGH